MSELQTKQNSRKKVLYIANIATHITVFHLPYLKFFKDNGYDVHVAINKLGIDDVHIPFADKIWDVPFGRSVTSLSNFRAFRKIKAICKNNDFEIIHSHTPLAGAVSRLATIGARRRGTSILYTSHGFTFYENAPAVRWMTFLPVEWGLSFVTDGIITINSEDFEYLKKFNFKSKGKYKIDGIGIDPKRVSADSELNKTELRDGFGYKNEDVLVLYIAEFIERKNHEFIIESIPGIISENKNIKFLFAGRGVLLDSMKNKVESLGINEFVEFLGFREDIGKIIKMCDIGISASKHEGLGLGVAEMMYNGLALVVSNDRGHRELVSHGDNGYIFGQENSKEFENYVSKVAEDKQLRDEFGKNAKYSMKRFLIDNSLEKMKEIYAHYMVDA